MTDTLGRIAALLATTFALGVSVFVAWSMALGRLAATGPGTVLRDQPFVVLGLVAALAALVGAAVGSVARGWSGRALVVVLVAAWLGELVVLVVAGSLIANEITPSFAPQLWAMATGGPVQPVAAIAGALIGRSLARRRAAAGV